MCGAPLAETGADETIAGAWPQAIRFRAEWDKSGFESITPIGAALRREFEVYLPKRAVVGDAWLFTMATDAERAPSKLLADWYLRRAEKLAGLPHQERGGWHAFRRGWATVRKALPVQDVMAAGGWRDVKALQSAYQGADPETVRRVVELEDTGS